MQVSIINKEESKELFKYWGLSATKCYNTPKKYAINVGKKCLKTGHFSGSRGRYIMFEIDGVPRALVDQLVRHEVGVYKNVESGRYINFSDFDFYIPSVIRKNPKALKTYTIHMEHTKLNYELILKSLEEDDIIGEAAYEAARGILPMNYNTGLVIGFTVESLINLMNKRLCSCSQDHIRKLAQLMRKEVIEILPELEEYLVPICKRLNYCPENEHRSCGLRPQKHVVENLVKKYMEEK